jgi:hypothetical protein
MTRIALTLLFAAPLAVVTAQREPRDQPHVEVVRASVIVEDSVARTSCTAVPHREPYVEPPRSHTCRVVEADTLPSAAGKRWTFVVQQHVSVYNLDDSAGVARADTIVETETVLFSSTRGSHALKAVLHGREEESVIRSIYPSVAEHAGAALVDIEFCVNGTAGCWEEFLRSSRDSWIRIPDPIDAIRPYVLRAFRGDSSHTVHSPRIDVRTLRGTAQIAARGDANCCASDRAEFQLALDGNRFRVVQFRVVANER